MNINICNKHKEDKFIGKCVTLDLFRILILLISIRKKEYNVLQPPTREFYILN